ncbi:conserved hypothetical protein [Planktothrix sp. PCC 11201]|uniref:vWA domain-containing protein n=1 Tax=Planktothrix sp. PCC 11201 TaxID=1729650 RepID=UPI0009234E32|nr:VWA domain-containing protein [Planktothrix sp. PCC 11201]SKB12358.1 conserved hypothetical protein [Planktothrix sp. PCC 11201]
MTLDIEFVDSPDPRCAVVLLLDTSGSMSGQRIQELNKGLVTFQQELSQDHLASRRVEVAIITFDSSVNIVQNFVTVDQFNPPSLSATGSTEMGQAIETGLNLLESRKADYKNNGIEYYRPWVLLITDGGPNPGWENAAQMVRQFAANKRVQFYAVGVQGADMNTLSQIAPANKPPLMLKGLDFPALFKWLSNSMSVVSASKPGDQTALAPVNAWAVIST